MWPTIKPCPFVFYFLQSAASQITLKWLNRIAVSIPSHFNLLETIYQILFHDEINTTNNFLNVIVFYMV